MSKNLKTALIAVLVMGVYAFTMKSVTDDPAERNVRNYMYAAEKEFGLRDTAAFATFEFKARHFEEPLGFEGEAEMEAARRVLGIPASKVSCLVDNTC